MGGGKQKTKVMIIWSTVNFSVYGQNSEEIDGFYLFGPIIINNKGTSSEEAGHTLFDGGPR